jgi:ABC-type branched-subunit amino acid transport system substrate-binding protein
LITAVAAVATIATGCGSSSDNSSGSGSESSGGDGGGGSYNVGFNDDLSGPIAFAGTAMQGGFLTYIDYVNDQQGGVNGKKIDVKSVDNRGDGATALSNYRDLVRDGAIATVGYTSSVAWSAAGAAADKTEVTQMAISGVDKWTDEEHPYLFKVGQTQGVAANIQGQFMDELAKQAGGETPTIGVFTITTASGPIFEDAAKKVADQYGWKIVNTQSVDPGASSCTSQAAAMAAAKPTMIISNLESAGEDVVCYNALKTRGFDGPIVNSFYSSSEKTFESLKADNWYAERVFAWPTDSSIPAAKEMYARAKKYGHADKIGDFFSDGYLTGMLVVEALKRCGADCDAQGFQQAMASIDKLDTGGLAGPHFGFTTGPEGHMAAPDGKIYQWNAGENQSTAVGDWRCGLPARCG